MSEFHDRSTVSRLVGAPPGYVGYDEGGQLTEKVRRRPFSVVLFDEIEKAHPDVFNTLLQILEDGRLTDGQGRIVDFKNTVIILTTNLGRKEAAFRSASRPADGDSGHERMKRRVTDELKQHLRPEFLNRIDDTIVFPRLDRTNPAHRRPDGGRIESQLRNQDMGLELTGEREEVARQQGLGPGHGGPTAAAHHPARDRGPAVRADPGQRARPGQIVVVDCEATRTRSTSPARVPDHPKGGPQWTCAGDRGDDIGGYAHQDQRSRRAMEGAWR